jgi:hypothetical protein
MRLPVHSTRTLVGVDGVGAGAGVVGVVVVGAAAVGVADVGTTELEFPPQPANTLIASAVTAVLIGVCRFIRCSCLQRTDTGFWGGYFRALPHL